MRAQAAGSFVVFCPIHDCANHVSWKLCIVAGGGGLLEAGKKRMPCQITIGMWLGYRQLRQVDRCHRQFCTWTPSCTFPDSALGSNKVVDLLKPATVHLLRSTGRLSPYLLVLTGAGNTGL